MISHMKALLAPILIPQRILLPGNKMRLRSCESSDLNDIDEKTKMLKTPS